MKILKIISRLIYIPAIAVALGIITLRIPYVQKSIAVHVLKKHFHEVSLQKISIGPSVAKINKLAFSFKKIDFKLDSCEIKWSAWNSFFLKEIFIQNLNLDGIFICTNSTEDTDERVQKKLKLIKAQSRQKNAKQAFDRLISSVRFLISPQISQRVSIEHFKITGLTSIDEKIISDIKIEGYGLAPLNTALVYINSSTLMESFPISKLIMSGQAKIHQSQNGSLDAINYAAECSLFDEHESGKNFEISFVSKQSADKNIRKLVLREKGNATELHSSEINTDKLQQKLTLTCKHDLNTSIFDWLRMHYSLPKISNIIDITGEFDLKTLNGTLKGSSECSIRGVNTKNLSPILRSGIFSRLDVALEMKNGALNLAHLDSRSKSYEGNSEINVQIYEPVEIWNAITGFAIWKDKSASEKQRLLLTFRQINPKMLLTNKNEFKIDTSISGQLAIFRSLDGFCIKSEKNAPIRLENINFRKNAKKYIEHLNAAFHVNARLGKDFSLNLSDIVLSDANDDKILFGSLDASQTKGNEKKFVELHATCNLDKLSHLPAFSGTNINSGMHFTHITIEKAANLLEMHCGTELKSLSIDNQQPIDGSGSWHMSQKNGNVFNKINLDVHGQNETSVDLSINSSCESSDIEHRKTKIILTGKSICVPDLLSVAKIPSAIFKSENSRTKFREKLSQMKAAKTANRFKNGILDKLPYLEMEMSANVQKLYPSSFGSIDNMKIIGVSDGEKLEIKSLTFDIENEPFEAKALLTANRNDTKPPYSLTCQASFSVQDLGKIFTNFAPNKTAPMTGRGRIDMDCSSFGKDIWQTLMEIQGIVTAQCHNGSINVSGFLPEKNKAIVSFVNLVTIPLEQKYEKAKYTRILISALQNIEYDSIQVCIKRDKSLNITLSQFDIIGPEIWVNAIGEISYLNQQNFEYHPLFVDVKVNVAGNLQEALNGLGLLNDHSIDERYLQGPRFLIGGTAGRPDFSEFAKFFYSVF